ncbi:MAG: Atu4866 domain-containing protein [Pseudoxanthomonas mexicana]|uniref:Atu4866 domain-containing protein n=1 Tax=Pseudoxanthomonas mexicana TaxID=128785 RepID=UPI0018DC0808|nr:Atu4866 domain-containing protein [Pseudoxanthomonas mexicana]MBL8257735.1 Atu4866 domain-containing protein [Pseudoxanthomonas mexicana]
MSGKTHALSVKPMAGIATRPAFHERERAVGETERFAIREIGDVIGTWATCDGFVRHTLFADGRCEESQGSRSCVFSGCYVLHGQRIDYQYDGDFFGYGEFINGELHQGGMVLQRASDSPM